MILRRRLPLLLIAAALSAAPAVRAINIISVDAELYALDDGRNYVDIWVQQSPDIWKDRVHGAKGDPGMIRVQGMNENVPDYISEPPRTDELSLVWANEWAPGWDYAGGSVWANFADRTVTVAPGGNPLNFFSYQFYGDALRLIWSNTAIAPNRVPDSGTTALLLAPLAALATFSRRRRTVAGAASPAPA